MRIKYVVNIRISHRRLYLHKYHEESQVYSHFGCMFVRNKIYWYSSRLNPSFSPPSILVASSGTAPTLVPFYLRRVSTPSASPSKPPPSYRTPACAPFPSPSFCYRHEPYPIHPGPSQSPTLQQSATAVMAAVTESIKVVLMRLNCRCYCRPLPPPTPLLPLLFVQRLRRCFNLSLSFRIVAFRYILLSRFLLHSPVPSSGTGIPLATAMDFVLSPQPTTLNRANFHLPIPSFPSPLDVSVLPETTAKTIQRARSVPGVSA